MTKLRNILLLMVAVLMSVISAGEEPEGARGPNLPFRQTSFIASECGITQMDVESAQEKLFIGQELADQPEINNCILLVGIKREGLANIDSEWIWSLATHEERSCSQVDLLDSLLAGASTLGTDDESVDRLVPLCYFLIGSFHDSPLMQISALGYLRQFDSRRSLALRKVVVPALSKDLHEMGWDFPAESVLELAKDR